MRVGLVGGLDEDVHQECSVESASLIKVSRI